MEPVYEFLINIVYNGLNFRKYAYFSMKSLKNINLLKLCGLIVC